VTGPARLLGAGEEDDAGDVLALAFLDDPVMAHCLPDGARRFEHLQTMFRPMTADALRSDAEVWVDPDLRCAARWVPPEGSVADLPRTDPDFSAMVEALAPESLERLGLLVDAVAAARPPEPSWYLSAVGTDPSWRGRGLATSVMAPVLARCDAGGVPAFLESTKEANLALYRRHGFEVTEVLHPYGADGPPVWPMLREPRDRPGRSRGQSRPGRRPDRSPAS
jgi:ribosomal protein S18 acetylase RimI-like enzyme